MGQGVGEVLTYAVGVAISPVPMIAVILMLFSAKARVNGSVFAAGWALALAVVSGVVYAASDAAGAASDSTASDTVSWGKILFGVLLLLLAARNWRSRPSPDEEPAMPKWMAGIDAITPVKAFGLAVLLAGLNPKNLLLAAGAGGGLAQVGVATTDAVVSLVVFVALATSTIGGPVIYYLAAGQRAKDQLDSAKAWLVLHNTAVMTVLFLVFGVTLIAKGLPPLTG